MNDSSKSVALAELRRLMASGEARRVRLASRLSLTEIATDVGVSAVTVSRWELGRRVPRGAAALRYFDLLTQLREGLQDVRSGSKGARS